MKFFTRKEFNHFIKLFLPLAASLLAIKGMQFIDTLMMGWIGPQALAAGALGTNIFITLIVFCRGVVSLVGVSIVQARASQQIEEIRSLLHQSFYLSIAVSIPLMFLAWQSSSYLMLIGQDPRVVADSQRLLNGLLWGIPGMTLFFSMREFISAFALARTIMTISLISIPLTFGVNYVLIYGKLGFPALGIGGIGISGALVSWFMFVGLLFYSSKQSVLKYYVTWRLHKPDFSILKNLWINGASSGVVLVLDMIAFTAAAIFTGYFGVTALAAYQIAMQCTSIAYNLPLAVTIITALEVGHGYASRNSEQIKRVVYLGISLGLLISISLSILFVGAPHWLAKIFLSENPNTGSDVYATAELFLVAASLLLCFDGTQAIIIGALRGFKDTITPMVMSIICYLFIAIPASYLLSFHTSLGAVGVWYGLLIGIATLLAFAALRLRQFFKKL
jgi:MATE family multidrug resistance protein